MPVVPCRFRNFSFYRSANADVMLSKEDISDEALKAAKIVHFGSVSLTADPSRTATLDAAARAKKLGAVITYDPNYRAKLKSRSPVASTETTAMVVGWSASTAMPETSTLFSARTSFR